MKDIEPAFTKGSRYRVMSRYGREILESEGEFLGYASFGNGTALRLRLVEDGTIRIIPLMMVLSVDVVESKEEEGEEDLEATRAYFG
ncbi:MAG: hypothetical protein ACLFUV_08245 [Methanomassiliicoccales archaeon]